MRRNIEISPHGSLLVFKKDYTAELTHSIIQEHNLRGLRIFAQLKEDRISDLDFLQDYTFLKALDISSVDDYDFSFLSKFKNLEELTINVEGKAPIDLKSQTNLENLTIRWRKGKILGLEKCTKITSLCLIEYTERNFTPISSLINLNNLEVKTSSIENVDGVEYLTNLSSLLLGNCKKLSLITKLRNLKNLTSLNLKLCPNIKNFSDLENLSNLKNLEISDCEAIDSIKFIKNISSLKRLELLGNTDVLDGDMMPAKGIKEVIYKHRKHYNAKIENDRYDQIVKNNLEKIKKMFG